MLYVYICIHMYGAMLYIYMLCYIYIHTYICMVLCYIYIYAWVSNKFPYRWFSLMSLNKEQEIKFIMRAGSGSKCMVANAFNTKHGTNFTLNTEAKKRKKPSVLKHIRQPVYMYSLF